MDDTQKDKGVTEKPNTVTPAAPQTVAPKFRYYCDSCTGIAFTSVEKKNPGVSHCRNCGKAVSGDREENYIPL